MRTGFRVVFAGALLLAQLVLGALAADEGQPVATAIASGIATSKPIQGKRDVDSSRTERDQSGKPGIKPLPLRLASNEFQAGSPKVGQSYRSVRIVPDEASTVDSSPFEPGTAMSIAATLALGAFFLLRRTR